jgi:hypothetical protein
VVVVEPVVDLLEAVEVEQQDRQRLVGPDRLADLLAEAVAEQHPVGQVGQVVVQRAVLEGVVVRLALGVVAQARDVDRACTELDVAQVQAHREDRPVAAQPGHLQDRPHAWLSTSPSGASPRPARTVASGPRRLANGRPIASRSSMPKSRVAAALNDSISPRR